ncbi:peptidase [Microbacterium algeriense]|uniref:ATP-dependent Clp protease proteolytic subunit n=2 Tax=Microbacterium algeriense TaxID=2615184 RepID=A0ABQ6VBJ5_9MICO|nr:peptidase [Microbacterium algeriense]
MPSPAGEGTVATIRLYGPIDSWGGWWGISASDVSDVLDALPESVTQIILRINSPGGEVFEAMSILNMLRAHKASVLAVVDGLAASAGSVIAVGCDETVMSPGTQMMIHSPSTIIWGNAHEMRKEADVLDSVEESIISIYRDKAGESAWGELLAAETWYTAEGAVEVGLADRVAVVKDAGETCTAGAEDDDPVDPLEGDTVEDKYQSARARLSRRPTGAASPIKPPSSPEPGNTTETEKLTMSDTFLAAVRDRLGVTDANASEETVLAAFDEHLAEQADTVAAPAAAIPAGTQLIEDNVLSQMRADAAAGREAREQQISDRRDGIIQNAMSEGRISAASAPKFRAMLDADEATATAVLNSLAENTVHVEEVGHADTLTSADDSLYGSIYPTAKEA